MSDRLNNPENYREQVLAAERKSSENNLPHRSLTYRSAALQTAELKRCMMLGVAARNELTFTAKDPIHNAPDICLAVSAALSQAGFEHEVTLGNLIRRGKHLVSNVSAKSLTNAFQAPETEARPNYYCWITLGDGSVFDFSLLSDVKPPARAPVQKGKFRTPKPKKLNHSDTVLMLTPPEHGSLYRYVPELVGFEVLQRLMDSLRR